MPLKSCEGSGLAGLQPRRHGAAHAPAPAQHGGFAQGDRRVRQHDAERSFVPCNSPTGTPLPEEDSLLLVVQALGQAD